MSWSDDEVLTAMCLWEVLCTGRNDSPLYEWVADQEGAWAARQGCANLAKLLEHTWDRLPESARDGVTFDWEFVPDWLGILHEEVATGPVSTVTQLQANRAADIALGRSH